MAGSCPPVFDRAIGPAASASRGPARRATARRATCGNVVSPRSTAQLVSPKGKSSFVLSDDYRPPSPLREVVANASVDDLTPENPVAAEMAQMRETLEEIRKEYYQETRCLSLCVRIFRLFAP